MAVFIELTTNDFERIRNEQIDRRLAGANGGTRSAGRRVARRPLRGLEIKEDRAAAIKVIQADGTEIPLVDAGAPYGMNQGGYTNFLLQQVTEARMEKHQIVETFGESYVFFFGESPRFLDVSMVVINSHDFNWEAEWWENYERYFRGTKLAEMGARLYMFYDDNVVEGYMLNAQAVKVSDQPFLVQMNFRLFLTGYQNITFIGDPNFPIRASVALPDGINLRTPQDTGKLYAALRGAALDAAKAQGFGEQVSDETLINIGGFDSKTRLSNFLRAVPRTVALPPTIVQSIENLRFAPNVSELIRADQRPIRDLIAKNQDEYIGTTDEGIAPPGFEPGRKGLPPAQLATVRTRQEVEDLWLETIAQLGCLGAEVNNPNALIDIGLMPKFGKDSSGTATFRPIAGVPFGVGLTDPASTNAQLERFKKDPLGAIFGGSASAELIDRSTTQGGGDRDYGYTSDYGRRPGVGRPGYGDIGGNGFGSGQGGSGDPGFRSKDSFGFAGVSASAEASAGFSRFNKPTRNSTVFGPSGSSRIGLGAGNSGLSGGGATRIEGKPSPFALVSVGGTLDIGAAAGASFGFGVGGAQPCSPGSPAEAVFSVGFP